MGTFKIFWKRNILRFIWFDIVTFNLIYTLASLTHHVFYFNSANPSLQQGFAQFVLYSGKFVDLFPVVYIISFYVVLGLIRWWAISQALPRIERYAFLIQAYFNELPRFSPDARALVYDQKVTINRYLNLSVVLVLQSVSRQVQQRFQPRGAISHCGDSVGRSEASVNFDDLPLEEKFLPLNDDETVQKTVGHLITGQEIDVFKKIKEGNILDDYELDFWLPIIWSTHIIEDAKQANGITPAVAFELNGVLRDMGQHLSRFYCLSFIGLPSVCLHFPIFVMMVNFFVEVFRQFYVIDSAVGVLPVDLLDAYFPFRALPRLLFLLCYFKIAQLLLSPLTKSDDLFKLNELITTNLEVAHRMSSDIHIVTPDIPIQESSRPKLWENGGGGTNLPQRADASNPGSKAAEEEEDNGSSVRP